MNERDAFLVGYLPRAAGLYFNGLELLAEADRTASLHDPQVAIRIGEERERVVAYRDAALAALDRVEDLMASARVPAVVRPGDASEYSSWADAVFEAVTDVLPGDSPQAVTHLLGYVLGEGMATVDLIAILSGLRELTPDHLWMRLQGDSLERERATAERRLGRLAAHPLLPPPVQEAAALGAHEVADAGPSGGYARRPRRAEAAATSLADQAAAIEAAL